MRVAFLLERFPAVSETFIVTQLAALERAGHEVSVISQHRPRPDEPMHEELLRSGILERTHYVDGPLEADSSLPVSEVPLTVGRHDVLHAHFGPNARRFLFARAQAGAPLVVTFHGYDFSSEPRRLGTSMYERLFERADAVTVPSEHMWRALTSLGCPPEKLCRVRLAIDVAAMSFRERRPRAGEPLRLVTVGRLVEKKGHEIALRALAAVRPSLGDVRYDLVGGGVLGEHLVTLARELGLDDVVTFHGARDSSFVRGVLERGDVFVLASRTAADGDQEGTPVALMEAMASGLPVVSTLHSGITEVVLAGRTGHLVPEGDVDALAGALLTLAREPDSWAALGRAGRDHVLAKYDVGPCTEQLVGVYRLAVEGHAAETAT